MTVRDLVFIYSAEHGAFWRPDGQGYTNRPVDEAGVWTDIEARAATTGCGTEKRLFLIPTQALYGSRRNETGPTGQENGVLPVPETPMAVG